MNATSFDPATAYLAAGFLYVIMPWRHGWSWARAALWRRVFGVVAV